MNTASSIIGRVSALLSSVISSLLTGTQSSLLLLRSSETSVHDERDFDTILQTRRTINSFKEDLPENADEIIDKAIRSAIYAPNHNRTEPWKFHLLGPKTIRKVCELNAEIVSKKKGEKAGQRKLERWLQMPGWIVVSCRTDYKDKEILSMDVENSLSREDYAACCCAVQNLCLSIHNSGMGTKWKTGAVNFDEKFREILGFEENEYSIGILWFGTPAKIPEAPPKKKSVPDVIVRHD